MTQLNASDARLMLMACADKIIESKPLLTEIDSKIGDGDHGIGMAGGLSKAKDKLASMESCSDVYELFTATGRTMLMSMGGASGVIFGTMFMGGAKGKSAPAITTAEFAQMMKGSLDAVKARGKAQVGDKTMVDAFEPAVNAMLAYTGTDFAEMLEAAEKAAADGVEATKDMIAHFGRAKSLMERAVGYQDAGATSTWLIFQTMHNYVKDI